MALRDVDTIVVTILENRSFDHMLGYLSAGAPSVLPVEGLRTELNWLANHANIHAGIAYEPHPLSASNQPTVDPPHGYTDIALQIGRPCADANLRSMGGFVESYVERSGTAPPDPSAVMGYFNSAALPVYDFLARNFCVCDHWFSAVPAGTQPNRLMAMAGASRIVDNSDVLLPDQRLVYDWLTGHGVTWCAYQSGGFLPFFSLMPRLLPEILASLTLSDLGVKTRFRRFERFAADWTSGGSMPSVIFIEPEYSDGPHQTPNDDHPPTGIGAGQRLIADIYRALTANPVRWAKTLWVITYDEHGGFFDHVPPLPISTTIGAHRFDTTGVRVPALLVSPHVEPGSVFRGNLDHTSLLQLMADRFKPTEGYSLAVNARQAHLNRIYQALSDHAPARRPELPQALTRALEADFVRTDAVAKAQLGTPATANAIALNRALFKAAADHPELFDLPGWREAKAYIEKVERAEPAN